MTTKVNPPVFAEVVGSWQDAIRAARAMLPLLGVALLVIAAYQTSLVVSGSVLNPRLLGRSIALLVEIAQGLVASVLLIPVAIAVHRYILLGETAQRYELTPSRTRFRRFLALTILIESALLVPRLAGMLVGATPARGIVFAVVIMLVLYLVLRTLLLFPAIATDAPGADWERAMQDSNGRAWRIFLVLLIAFVPIIVASALLLLSVGRSGLTGNGAFAVIAVINAVGALAWLVVGAAVASRLYRAYADAMESG